MGKKGHEFEKEHKGFYGRASREEAKGGEDVIIL